MQSPVATPFPPLHAVWRPVQESGPPFALLPFKSSTIGFSYFFFSFFLLVVL